MFFLLSTCPRHQKKMNNIFHIHRVFVYLVDVIVTRAEAMSHFRAQQVSEAWFFNVEPGKNLDVITIVFPKFSY